YEDETTVDDFGDFPLISREQSLIAQLEAAQKKVNDLELADYKFWHGAACDNHQKVLKLEAALSAANEKLLKPVKLPKTNGYWDAEEQAFERGIQLARQEIRIAGFRVEGDE
ncbi:hypothetical protein V2A85_24090, partial [Yersinia sp. 1252 StPb PI]|uniref:hypothetical protein n=1 Tax=Yersinia sp. 1252 StPb PI TaxID=3117404 RepID=UPI003B27E1AF